MPGDCGLVSGESVWTSARLTSSHTHLSSSSETEDEEESEENDETREVERHEEKECGTLEISDINDDAEGEEMKGDGKDHHIDFSSSSVGEDKEITDGIETQERESALGYKGQVCDIEDECRGDNDAKTEEESDEDDNEEDDREREDPDDYTESGSSDEADCEDSDVESDECDSTVSQDPSSPVWPETPPPTPQPTRRGFSYLSSPSLSAPGSLGPHSTSPTLIPPPTTPMGLARVSPFILLTLISSVTIRTLFMLCSRGAQDPHHQERPLHLTSLTSSNRLKQ